MSTFSSCRGTESPSEMVPPPNSRSEIHEIPDAPEIQAELRIRQVDKMTMVFVPGGTFQMGSADTEIEDAITLCKQHYSPCNSWYYEREAPLHPVSLDDYWLDQTEVSNDQYRLCVDAGICTEPITCKKGEPTYLDPEKNDHPVVCVDWDDAQTYCQWAGGRMPTEAEWEYAIRGAEGLIFPWGNEFDGSKLNYCEANCNQPHADDRFDDGYSLTAPVGSYPSGVSWSGAYNMSGNVSEWVSDWFGNYLPDGLSNPLGPESGSEKMLKGCSWFFNPAYCRGAMRPSVSPDTRFDYLGFRCVVPMDQKMLEGETDMSEKPLIVPQGQLSALDGIISPGEWDSAVINLFTDGSELLLMQDGEFLYVGIRAIETGTIAGNVFIQRGDDIQILHSSAALGTAIYRKGDENWQQIQDFVWRCRSTGNTETALSERDEFLAEESWLATNGLMGTPNELEYQIKIPDGDFRLVAVYIKASPPYEKVPWPPDLTDDTIMPTSGGFPYTFKFSPEQWVEVNLTEIPY